MQRCFERGPSIRRQRGIGGGGDFERFVTAADHVIPISAASEAPMKAARGWLRQEIHDPHTPGSGDGRCGTIPIDCRMYRKHVPLSRTVGPVRAMIIHGVSVRAAIAFFNPIPTISPFYDQSWIASARPTNAAGEKSALDIPVKHSPPRDVA